MMFDVGEHAYQADGSPLPVEAPLPKNTAGTKTLALAVWVSVPPSKAAAAVLDHNTVVVALWAWQQQHLHKNKLVYATFVDSLPGMSLLRGWIQQYQPSALYWACQEQQQQAKTTTGSASGTASQQTSSSSSSPSSPPPHKKQKTKQVNIWEPVAAFMQSLSENDDDNEDNDDDATTAAAVADANAPNAATPAPLQALSVTGYPTHLFTDAHQTMPPLLQELVQYNEAAQFALKANRDLAVSISTNGGNNTSSSRNNHNNSKNKLWSALALLWHGRGGGGHDTTTITGTNATQTQYSYDIVPAARAPFVVVDRAAATSLNIWPVAHQGQAAAQGATTYKDSIYGLLSKPCHTPGGKQLLKQWLQQPLTDINVLQDRQDAVAHLVQCSVERTALRSVGLAPLQLDLGQLATKLARYKDYFAQNSNNNNCSNITIGEDDKALAFGSTRKALQTLYEVYLVASQKLPALLDQVQQVAAVLQPPTDSNNNNGRNNVLWKTWNAVLPQLANELKRSVALVEAVLDLDLAPREFLVQATFHADLKELQDDLRTVQADVEDEHAAMNDTWMEASGRGSSQVRLDFDATDSTWQFRLPQTNDSKTLQNELKHHVQVHRVLKNGVHFSTKRLRQLSEKRRSLLAQYDRLQRQVTVDALQVGVTYHAVIGRLARVVAHMDAVAALADVSAYNNYCRPELTDSDDNGMGIRLHEARHPCVELQENVEFIPNNAELVYGESSFMILTGPNMGGKSTYIRALGANVLLAQIGCYVPAKKARINLCHHLLARVGAGDLPDRGISTFMAEMIEASGILQQASRRSLIMIDELGRGTSTWDGFGLARAIAEYIVDEIRCLSVFATHFHELTALGETKAMVQNAHVTAQKGQHGLTFLYQVRPGPCLESFGIQVAEMANVPKVVVQDAKRKASELERFEYSHQTTTKKTTTSDEDDDDVLFLDRFVNVDLDSVLANANHDPSSAMEHLKTMLFAAASPQSE